MPVVTVTIAAKKIGRLLVSRKMNQSGLARDVGVTPAAVSYWMKGKPPTLEMIRKLIAWSGHYLTVDDFTTPYRRNMAIPDPPSLTVEGVHSPFVAAPKDKPLKRLFNGFPRIDFIKIDRGHQGVVISESTAKVIIGENTLGMSAPLEMLRAGKWVKP